MKKKIAITIGDPAGIGPEVTLKAVLSGKVSGLCTPVLIGDSIVIEEALKLIKGTMRFLKDVEVIDVAKVKKRNFARNAPVLQIKRKLFAKGKPTAAGGSASV
ncbi:MAG TPA: hypothetical protein VN328_12670, partial [Thermodesulfovibrionales bacterium]|nr:hypothetical protein [Thermodesulfovibrionales bacterium]